ncbi:hypothetical protein GO496_08055 [Acidovorax citrulli]|nr:hypothetical protein [Paracidovorax citrulli]
MEPDLSDDEIDRICAGLTQSAAKVRYLRTLGLRVDRRPNGRPLVARAEWGAPLRQSPGAAVRSQPGAAQQRAALENRRGGG